VFGHCGSAERSGCDSIVKYHVRGDEGHAMQNRIDYESKWD